MANIDKYKYISVMDNDETVVPPKLNPINGHSDLLQELKRNKLSSTDKINKFNSNLNCERFSNKNKSSIESFLDFVSQTNSPDKKVSYNFDQVYFIKMDMIQHFFDKLDKILENNSIVFPLNININNLNDVDPNVYGAVDKQGLEAFDYTFAIQDDNDLTHATNLLNINKFLLRPYLEANKWIINKTCERFDRFFVMSDFSSGSYKTMGKSIHNTQTTLTFTLHAPYNSAFIKVPYQYGYLSHFRGYFHLNKSKKPGPITNIFIDLSYFNCYFKAIVEDFKKEYANQ